ncbi:MAG: arginine--tRNA ligase [Oscillospiraceae bacterium]|nr:arginine--tRNA ligase [Oscillospiraceae bacterium]
MYNNLYEQAKEQLAAIIKKAYNNAVGDGVLSVGAGEPLIEIPKDLTHGDLSSSFAMQAARALKKNPREIAGAVIERMDMNGGYFTAPEVMGAGFINVKFCDNWYGDVLKAAESADYGRVDLGKGQRVLVEFVSANPTGPMTIGNARGGVLGDTLSSVLSAAGYDVSREFYLNDAGNQIEVMGRSLAARYEQIFDESVEFPDDGYHGDYIKDFARAYYEKTGKREVTEQELIEFVLPQAVERMKLDLERYGIRFDRWFAESELYKSGYVDDTVKMLTERGYTFEKDGALWFKGEELGCDKDFVLRRSNGHYTYIVPDLAYHSDKFIKRGFDICINVMGGDHHGHSLRFKPSIAAMGIDPDRLHFVLVQMVSFLRDGEVIKASKRTGKTLTLGDLLDELSKDAVRFFFNMRQANAHLEFDMSLALREDSENPVYYVQYAHARITSMLKLLEGENAPPPKTNGSLLAHEAERRLIKQIAMYPEEILAAAKYYEPSRINAYLTELANCFHSFYNAVRLRGAETETLAARLALCHAVRNILRSGLTLLGITAPEKM